eukprot:scpid106389/ scgid20874/ 
MAKPSVREIIVYATLECLQPHNTYHARQPTSPTYIDACNIINQVVSFSERVSPMQIRSYLLRANLKGAQVGKYRGRVRWSRFKSIISTVWTGDCTLEHYPFMLSHVAR